MLLTTYPLPDGSVGGGVSWRLSSVRAWNKSIATPFVNGCAIPSMVTRRPVDWWRGASGGSRRARARPRSSFLLLVCGTGCPSRTTRRRTPRCLRAKRQMSARSFAIRRACARRKETQYYYTKLTASEAASPRQASARRSSGRRCYWLVAELPARFSAASSSSWPPRASSHHPTTTTAAARRSTGPAASARARPAREAPTARRRAASRARA